jgi:hypothetical protein
MTEKEKDSKTSVDLYDNKKLQLDNFLSEEDVSKFKELTEELRDTYNKNQSFRTEVEMRFSVLDDGRHPTRGSKYWQSVREQNSHLEGLILLSFEYRKNEVKIKKIEKKIKETEDPLKKESLQIDLDEKLWIKRNFSYQGFHRMREIKAWSKIKKELDDGSFSTQNVEEHQLESYKKVFLNKKAALTPGTPYGDRFNIYSQLQTVERILEEKQIETEKRKELDKK